MIGLANSVVIVTGAASGIGEECARRLHREGCRVVLVDWDSDALNRIVTELGSDVLGVVANVSLEEDVEKYMTSAVERFGRVDRVFLNAGIAGSWAGFLGTSAADFDHVIAINLRGVFLGLRAAFACFVRQGGGGTVVTTASVGGLSSGPSLTGYVASKHGVIGLTRSASVQGGPLGIRVNSIAPAMIDTPLSQKAMDTANSTGDSVGVVDETSSPMNRFGRTDEVAGLVAFLLSDESEYVNGVVVPIDGGALADSPIRPAARSTSASADDA